LGEIPRHTLLEFLAPTIDLPSCKITISIVDRFELAAVDRDVRQTYLATEIDEARALWVPKTLSVLMSDGIT
jgi:hypothetical protein